MQAHVVVIGAGIGGLTAAALLVQAGHAVTVLEAHVYPGGSAGTFYHKGFRFDAGATLAGGFAPGAPHARVAEQLGLTWPVTPVDPAWVVHLPDARIMQWAERARWAEERRAAFPRAEAFWRLQERLADVAWGLAARDLPWPPHDLRDVYALARGLRADTLMAAPYAWRALGAYAPRGDARFDTFLDAQLLISAQTTAAHAGALYGSAALDLPRRGVNHVRGGMGALSTTLMAWIRAHGGTVLLRQTVTRIECERGRAVAVHTAKGLRVPCTQVIANVTPWGLRGLLGDAAPAALVRETRTRAATWGAFTLYLGLARAPWLEGLADHHQIVVDPSRPLGEGNSVFLSLSPADDATRAPAGMRAATLSTHTALAPWWQARRAGAAAYAERRGHYAERVLDAVARVWPEVRAAVRLSLAGTPSTFERFTRRPFGMVGGFPQTMLWAARGPQTGVPNVWLVGDSIFPGQSTAGVTVGAWRVAASLPPAPSKLRP